MDGIVQFRPRHCIHCCAFNILWALLEARTKARIINHERFPPLIEHFINLAQERHNQRGDLQYAARHPGESDLTPEVTRKPVHQRSHRLRRRARQHPRETIRIVVGHPRVANPAATSGM